MGARVAMDGPVREPDTIEEVIRLLKGEDIAPGEALLTPEELERARALERFAMFVSGADKPGMTIVDPDDYALLLRLKGLPSDHQAATFGGHPFILSTKVREWRAMHFSSEQWAFAMLLFESEPKP